MNFIAQENGAEGKGAERKKLNQYNVLTPGP